MVQVNTSYNDALIARIDALAAESEMSRADFFRAIAEEAAKAREQGREIFEPPEAPIDPDAALALAQKVEQVSIDLDRIARSWDRREKKLLEAFHATEESNREAQARLTGNMVERFRDGAEPFVKKMVLVRQLVDDLGQTILAEVREPSSLKAINTQLSQLRRENRKHRRQFHFHLFRDWKLAGWELGLFAIGALIALLVFQIALANVLPSDWFATKLTLRMYGSADVAICELYEYSRHVERCPVLVPDETASHP